MREKKDRLPTEEELLERHRKARTRRRRRIVITVVVIVAVLATALVVGLRMVRRRLTEQFASAAENTVESAQVTVGEIRTTVSASGTLTEMDEEEITMPASLEIEDFCVEEGDRVKKGDLIATVTETSLFDAMAEIQATLDDLDDAIEEASDEEIDAELTTGVSGRVKSILVEEGDEVVTAMAENGALMLLSLDGSMAVDVNADGLAVDDVVTVTTGDGDRYEGTVEKKTEGTATILLTDKGPACEEEVTVTDEEGTLWGSGTLYIHSPLAITGYAGTVDEIKVSEGKAVSAGDVLLTLTDTEVTVRCDALQESRQEAQESLEELTKLYQQGGVCASGGGLVRTLSSDTAVSEGTESMMIGEESEEEESVTVATLSNAESMVVTIPVDETKILSLEEGQEASVSVDSLEEESFEGRVTSVGTDATTDSGVTTYPVEITVERAEEMLPGMSASVEITIEGAEDALQIPVEALHQTSSTAYVYTEYDEETEEFGGMTEVTVGLMGSSAVEITSGLSEGDTVYYTSSGSLSDLMPQMGGFGGMRPGGTLPDGENSGGMQDGSFDRTPGGGLEDSSGGARGERGERPDGALGAQPGGRN